MTVCPILINNLSKKFTYNCLLEPSNQTGQVVSAAGKQDGSVPPAGLVKEVTRSVVGVVVNKEPLGLVPGHLVHVYVSSHNVWACGGGDVCRMRCGSFRGLCYGRL